LKQKGYGAMVDDMDAGVLADNPIVLFSPEKMGAKKSVPNTEAVIAEAKRNLTELKNRKLPEHLVHSSVDDFLEHFGVKGMHWGVRKAASSVGDKAKKTAVSTTKVAAEHPYETGLAVLAAHSVYQHRGEIAGTAVIAGKVGAYLVKQAFTTKDSEVSSQLAIGRQVVQGFVIHG
jgi:hypothetical protein